MRVTATDATDGFRVKAYAGGQGVLLAFDLVAERRRGLLGFALRQKEGTAAWQWLFNSLTFPGRAHRFPQWGATPSHEAPIQKFRWADYTVQPGRVCRYRVHPVYGTPARPELADPLEVVLRTDDGRPAGERVTFNRAVAASQAFGRRFADLDALLTQQPRLPIEDWPEAPRRWLENGLLDAVTGFLARATGAQWALDVAIYEFELPALAAALRAAQQRGVRLRVLYHGKPGDEQTQHNEAALAGIAPAARRARVTSKIFHHKFAVLSRVMASGAVVPRAVLAGSTNLTENGVYRQANVVHVSDARDTAARFAALFDVLWAAPADVPAARAWIDANNPIDAAARSAPRFVGFSPRSGGGDLDEFVRLMRAARRDLLFATAFALPEPILDAMLGQRGDDVLRYGVQNTASRITGFHVDRTADFTATALLSQGLEGWLKEGLRGQRGNLLVHLKALVIDFTGDAPVVVSGSHNLSASASRFNDENFIVMRGDTDLADRYGLEVMRFYDHYRFRYYARLLALKKAQPLAEDDRWSDAYYQPGHLKRLSRLRFAGR